MRCYLFLGAFLCYLISSSKQPPETDVTLPYYMGGRRTGPREVRTPAQGHTAAFRILPCIALECSRSLGLAAARQWPQHYLTGKEEEADDRRCFSPLSSCSLQTQHGASEGLELLCSSGASSCVDARPPPPPEAPPPSTSGARSL